MSQKSRDKAAARAARAARRNIDTGPDAPLGTRVGLTGYTEERAPATLAAYDGPYDFDQKPVSTGRTKSPKIVEFRFGEIMAGPYADRPDWTENLCLLEVDPGGPRKLETGFAVYALDEIPTAYHFPIKDFSVPSDEDMVAAVRWAYMRLREGKTVYVGCLGGIGRTGTFLACLALLDGKKEPVLWVRDHYLPHAVETPEQMAFVDSLKMPWLLRLLVWWDGIRRAD